MVVTTHRHTSVNLSNTLLISYKQAAKAAKKKGVDAGGGGGSASDDEDDDDDAIGKPRTLPAGTKFFCTNFLLDCLKFFMKTTFIDETIRKVPVYVELDRVIALVLNPAAKGCNDECVLRARARTRTHALAHTHTHTHTRTHTHTHTLSDIFDAPLLRMRVCDGMGCHSANVK